MSNIEDQAQYYNNLPLCDRNIKAVVHLEAKEDIPFWDYQLQNAYPSKYHYVAYSKNNNGADARGCEQCLRYKPYLTKRFFICIDSDLRLLKGEEGLTAENRIAQTYTYSWENHLCEAEHLQHRYHTKVPNPGFDFSIFLKNLSVVLYLPLLYLVHDSQEPSLNQQWNISKFNTCLPLQPKRKELEDNGKPYIEKVKKLFADALKSLQPPANMTNENLKKEEAYLHIQGHQIYYLILHIGTLLCKGTGVAFKTGILHKTFPINGYSEIENLQTDLKQILSVE